MKARGRRNVDEVWWRQAGERGRARLTLAFANGNLAERAGRGREEGRVGSAKKVIERVYTGITLLSARGSGEIPGRARDERGTSAGRAHPPTMGRATIYYSRAS